MVALDKQLGLLKDSSTKDEKVSLLFKSLDEFFTYTADLEVKPSVWRYFKTPLLKKLMNAYDNIQKITLEYVNEAMERIDSEAKKGIVKTEIEQSVLEKLLKINKKVATIMAMDMLMAGVDTVSNPWTVDQSVPYSNLHFTTPDFKHLHCCNAVHCPQPGETGEIA